MVKHLCLMLLFLTLSAWGQGLEWAASLSTPRCRVGEQVVLELRLSGAKSDPLEPDVPDIAGVSMEFAGASKNVSMINGVTSAASTYTYVLTPSQPGELRVPGISIRVDGKTYTSEPLKLEVLLDNNSSSNPPSHQSASPPVPGLPSSGFPWGGPIDQLPSFPTQAETQPVLVECEVSNAHPYVGELVIYTFRFLHRVNLVGGVRFEPPLATGMLREELGQTQTQVVRNGVTYAQSEVRTALFPTAPGPLTIAATRLSCQIAPNLFDGGFSMMWDGVRELSTQPVELQVLALPGEGRPPSFNGAVGHHFELKASLNRNQVKAGEPVKLQISILGDEHPDLLLDPALPNWPGIRSYSPDSSVLPYEKPNYRAGKIFTIPLVPQHHGEFNLSDLSWSYFDPSSHRYVTLTANSLGLKVEGGKQDSSAGNGPSVMAVDPLRQPQIGQDVSQAWASQPGVVLLAFFPWGLSLLAWFFSQARSRYAMSLQTHTARLRRATRLIKRAKTLEELATLAYQGLEISSGRPLRGLPLGHLREFLSPQLVEQLEVVESARYAPQSEKDNKRLEAFRKLLLQELRDRKV